MAIQAISIIIVSLQVSKAADAEEAEQIGNTNGKAGPVEPELIGVPALPTCRIRLAWEDDPVEIARYFLCICQHTGTPSQLRRCFTVSSRTKPPMCDCNIYAVSSMPSERIANRWIFCRSS